MKKIIFSNNIQPKKKIFQSKDLQIKTQTSPLTEL